MGFKKTALSILFGTVFTTGLTTGAWANTQTSEDSTTVKFSIGDGLGGGNGDGGFVLISIDKDTLDLGKLNSTAQNYSQNTYFCIYASGVGGGNTFDIDVDVTKNPLVQQAPDDGKQPHTIPYTAGFENFGDGASVNYNPTSKVAQFKKLKLTSLAVNGGGIRCSGFNARLTVTVQGADASIAPAGEYEGTIGLMVSAK